ncbi:hypothetical protein EES43_17115 [Streptomyces sp. ADI96-02]|nr:hypothetical protein EES43_17115 [Streptomyces sp. ADI96-02]
MDRDGAESAYVGLLEMVSRYFLLNPDDGFDCSSSEKEKASVFWLSFLRSTLLLVSGTDPSCTNETCDLSVPAFEAAWMLKKFL